MMLTALKHTATSFSNEIFMVSNLNSTLELNLFVYYFYFVLSLASKRKQSVRFHISFLLEKAEIASVRKFSKQNKLTKNEVVFVKEEFLVFCDLNNWKK